MAKQLKTMSGYDCYKRQAIHMKQGKIRPCVALVVLLRPIIIKLSVIDYVNFR